MTVKIRLARTRKRKKHPFYKIVVTDSRSPRDGKFIEKVGTYNPLLSKDDEKRVVIVRDRITYWLDHGAQPTERVALFLRNIGVSKTKPSAAV